MTEQQINNRLMIKIFEDIKRSTIFEKFEAEFEPDEINDACISFLEFLGYNVSVYSGAYYVYWGEQE